MASLSEHETNQTISSERPILVRLLAYARPYVTLILLTMALSLVFSGGRYVRAYLMKPILDDVLLPHGAMVSKAAPSAWLRNLQLPGGEEKSEPPPPPAPLDDEQRAERERQIRENFAKIVLVALVLIFVVPLAQLARSYTVEYILGRIYIDMERDICAKLLALPLRFHHDRSRGDVLSRTVRDVGSAHSALSLLFGEFLQSALLIVVGVGFLFYISWQLSLITLLLGPTVFGVISLFGRRIRSSARRRQEAYADLTQRLLEIFGGIKVIKAFRAEAMEDAAFRRVTHKLFRRSMKVAKNRVLARSLVEMLNNGMAIGMLMLGALLVLRGRWGLTPGDLAAFAAAMATTYKPVKGLAKGWVRLMDAQPAAERYFEVLDSPVEIRDAPDAVRIDGVSEGVRLCNVSFSYGREPVLNDVSIEVRAGEMVAIVGRTGAGKTTLVELLLRFYDPTSGSVEIDGIDLRRIERNSLLGQIAVVSQEPFLFDGTIRDNIRYGRPDASEEEVLAAARAAHVDKFASQLPDGYDTEVGVVGVRLSGGQRQRVTIARAILKDPAILIFDEATSSLDSKSERHVQSAIETLLSGRTVFVIAHRLSTIHRADKIIVLENGTVTQTGTHAELIRGAGLYRELVTLQTTPTGEREIQIN